MHAMFWHLRESSVDGKDDSVDIDGFHLVAAIVDLQSPVEIEAVRIHSAESVRTDAMEESSVNLRQIIK